MRNLRSLEKEFGALMTPGTSSFAIFILYDGRSPRGTELCSELRICDSLSRRGLWLGVQGPLNVCFLLLRKFSLARKPKPNCRV